MSITNTLPDYSRPFGPEDWPAMRTKGVTLEQLDAFIKRAAEFVEPYEEYCKRYREKPDPAWSPKIIENWKRHAGPQGYAAYVAEMKALAGEAHMPPAPAPSTVTGSDTGSYTYEKLGERRVLTGAPSLGSDSLNLPTSAQKSTTHPQTDPAFKFQKVPGRVCDYVLLPLKYKFDGLFGRGRISIIGGSSGAGKTSLMSELLFQQQHRKLFLGHQGGGLKPLTIFADRGELSNMETLDRLGLLDAKLSIAHLSVCFDGDAVRGILDLIEKQDPLPEVVFVEGADALVSDAAKTQVVSPFLSALQRIAEHYHIAIVLSVGAPKAKPREQHTLKRDRIFGSQIWPRMADTIVTLESVGDGTGNRRDLTVQHRNAPSEMFELEFQNGRLVPRAASADIDALEIWMLERGDGAESWFTRGEAVAAMSKAETGLQRSAVYARIKEMLGSRRLEKRYNKARRVEELQLKRAPLTPDEIELQEALKDF